MAPTTPRGPHATNPDLGFTLPPLDGSLVLTEMYDFNYENNPDHCVFVHPNGSGGQTKLLYSDVVPAIHRAARFGADLTELDLDHPRVDSPTIAVLASSDTITYITTVLGLVRAGIVAFLIAPRCSPLAVAALLSKIKPTHILVSQESSIRELAEAGLLQLKSSKPEISPPKICSMPTFESIYAKGAPFVPVPPLKRDWSDPRLILHSSGSTSLPKPITWNDRICFQIMLQSTHSKQDMCGQIYAAHGLAMFHSVAWAFVQWIPVTGLILGTFEPASPATVPSPEAVFQGFVQSSALWGFAVPSFIEQWSADETKVEYMRRMNGLTYGGGPLNKQVGDRLVNTGVKIQVVYGTTEVGGVSTIFYGCLAPEWYYFHIHPDLEAQFIPIGDGAYEVAIVASPDRELTIVNSTFDGKDSHTISDLLVPHPTKPNLWRVIGRSDDQIILSTGEKTNPTQLESIISQDPRVNTTVMFGRGRFQVGVIVELKQEFAFDPSDEVKLANFRNQLWPKIEEMNAMAPSFSRLYKEMVLVSNPSKPFSYTGKGTVRKAKVIEEYEPEINALYEVLEQMTQTEPPETWTTESSLLLVNTVIEKVLKRAVKENEDIFEAGCDSLQATWIRNSLVHALRKTPDVSLDHISSGFIYEHPTVASLSKYILSVVHDGESCGEPCGVDGLHAMVDRYANMFPKHIASSPPVNGEVIFVSGTTGALGSAVLAILFATKSVRKIYAFNRSSSSKGIIERQKEALRSRGYDPEIAVSSKVILVEGQLNGSDLGIGPALEDEIRCSVTGIIHTAWRVDFNLSVASFESAIGGIRTLIDLALSSPLPQPPRLLFTSSVGALRNIASVNRVQEVLIDDPSVPLGQGYGESKWIAERILLAAATETPLRPTVLRIGQISGGNNGSWNTSDWLPAIVKSSLTLGCLPEFKGLSSWIPLDLAAQTIVDIRNEELLTVNLVHPRPVPCLDLFKAFSEELSLPLVPYAEWEAKLESAAAEASDLKDPARISAFASRVPAATLLEFFKGTLKAEEIAIAHDSNEHEALGFPMLVTENAHKASDAFRNAHKLGKEDVRLWLAYWKDVGFISY